MIEKLIIVTNNQLSRVSLCSKYRTDFIEGTLMDVLTTVRDYIHKGHRLLTHPLMGSIKPNETPYKTVAVSLDAGIQVDYDSLMLIENSIETARRFLQYKPLKNWPESVLQDFRLIDYDLISNALK